MHSNACYFAVVKSLILLDDTFFNLLKFSRRKKKDRHSEAGNVHFIYYTPENERLEPKNHPIEKRKTSSKPNLPFGAQNVHVPGCNLC